MMTYRGRVYTQVKVGPARQQQHRKEHHSNTAKTTERQATTAVLLRHKKNRLFHKYKPIASFQVVLKKFISLNSQRKQTSSFFTDVVLFIQTSVPCSNSKCPPKTIALLDTPTRSVKVDSDAPSAQNKHEQEGAGRQSNSVLDLRGVERCCRKAGGKNIK